VNVPTRLRTFLLAVLCLLGMVGGASAASFVWEDESVRVWNGIIVHERGASRSSFVVNEYRVTDGAEAELARSLEFATADAWLRPLGFSVSSSVDATDIDLLGYDKAIAEASAYYEAEMTLFGGSGNVRIQIEARQDERVASSDPSHSYSGLRNIRVREGSTLVGWLRPTDESVVVTLEYGTTYRFDVAFTAYSRAAAGYTTSTGRDLAVSLSVVPEPGGTVLLLLGLAIRLAPRRSA
jgi:hypothetical protein